MGKVRLDWAQIINDNIHTQLLQLVEKSYFTMSSYIVYMFVRHPRLLGLICLGDIGNGLN